MSRPHLALLDGLRGYAALMVLIYHLRHYFDDVLPVANGYLAVDLFFMMSGVVVALSYGDRLREGSLSVAGFARRRFLRLYPAYLLGAVLGLAVMVLQGQAGGFVALVWHALMLPQAVPQSPAGPFPLDPPAWSLFFEIWGNLAYAVLAVRARTAVLAATVAVALAGYLLASHAVGTVELGVAWGDFGYGVFRFWFGFGLGVLIWRMQAHLPRVGRAGWAVVVLAMLFPAVPGNDVARFVWIILVLPAGVIVAMQLPAPAGLCRNLGLMSYPLYILHWPIMVGMTALALHWDRAAWASPWVGAAIVGLTLVATAVVTYWAEPRLRAAMGRVIPSR